MSVESIYVYSQTFTNTLLDMYIDLNRHSWSHIHVNTHMPACTHIDIKLPTNILNSILHQMFASDIL